MVKEPMPEKPVFDEPITTDDLAVAGETETIWMRYRFALLLAGTVLIALTLTVISMVIYTQSGAAQLDLSRPGYRSVSDKVEKGNSMTTFSPTGTVNKDVINDFITQYEAQAEKTKSVDAFNGDPLNPEVLEFGSDPSNE